MATPTFTPADNKPIQWTCSLCGAVVADTNGHIAWHQTGVV